MSIELSNDIDDSRIVQRQARPTTQTPPCAPCVQRSRLFSGVLLEDYKNIWRAGRVKTFARGELLYSEGEPASRVLLLTSGLAKVTKTGREGEEVILRLAVAGEFLSAEIVMGNGIQGTTAQAFRDCRALIWDARVFKELLGRYPALYQNLVAILGDHLRELEDRFREVATERVGSRVARQLLRLLKTIGQPADAAVEVGLTREDLAGMTGTTLFTVSRLLSAWEAQGVVRPRREAVAVCNVGSLQALSQEE